MSATVLALLVSVCIVAAKDPAEGWLGYATGTNPDPNAVVTHIEAKWVVPDNPRVHGAFYSPWFGIETSDNLNLLQPVNPWMGSSWSIYNEYFQWKPVDNRNSKSHEVKAGDVVFGSITFNKTEQQYTLFHQNLNDTWSVSTVIPVQKLSEKEYKIYTILYFVFEKEANCDQYPPNNQVTFFDIKVEYDGAPFLPTWTTAYVDDVCNNRAQIINNSTIQITWKST